MVELKRGPRSGEREAGNDGDLLLVVSLPAMAAGHVRLDCGQANDVSPPSLQIGPPALLRLAEQDVWVDAVSRSA